MFFRPLTKLAVFGTLWTAASAQLDLGNLLGLDLDIGLLQNGALINIDAFANLLTNGQCQVDGVQTVGVSVSLLGLINVCSCVNAANLLTNLLTLTTQTACPPCAGGASPTCGGGKCACACPAGTYADQTFGCLPITGCTAPNTLVPTGVGASGTCQCAAGYISNGAGGCVLAPSARARLVRKAEKPNKPHHIRRHPHAARAAQQAVFPSKPVTSGGSDSLSCPNGETACQLPSGGFECLDVTASLNSCGGCVGDGLKGVNCLAIPGALNVECHASKCQVASCFRGWRYEAGQCV